MSRALIALLLVSSLVSGVFFFTPNNSAEYDEEFYEYHKTSFCTKIKEILNGGDIYNDKSRINNARAVVPSLAQEMLDNGIPTNVVIRTMLIYGQGLYSSTSKIHNGKWTIRNNKTGPNTVILNKNNPNNLI